jgi:hypothetical protein
MGSNIWNKTLSQPPDHFWGDGITETIDEIAFENPDGSPGDYVKLGVDSEFVELGTKLQVTNPDGGVVTSESLIGPQGPDVDWNTFDTYLIGDVAWYASAFYECIADNTNEPPDVSPTYWTEIAASPGVTWNTDSEYNIEDLVWYPVDELFYESLVNLNVGNTPAPDANWKIAGGLSGVISDFDFSIGTTTSFITENTGVFSSTLIIDCSNCFANSEYTSKAN